MFIETIRNIPPELFSLPLFAITLHQVSAILIRDERKCQFLEDHNCGKKLRVHHINGDLGDKADLPENLISVCKNAEWGYLHNGASLEEKIRWAGQLAILATQNTSRAIAKGWKFPTS